jgi:hypothetical protein
MQILHLEEIRVGKQNKCASKNPPKVLPAALSIICPDDFSLHTVRMLEAVPAQAFAEKHRLDSGEAPGWTEGAPTD